MTPDPLIVLAAPNGAYKQASDHGALPLTPEAMAATAQACLEAGASILHLHVRDALGRHSLDAGLYRDAIAAVRQRVGQALVIQVTTEAARVYGAPAQRALVAELRPEAVSVALRELDFRKKWEAIGSPAMAGTPEAFGRLIRSETARLGRVVREAGVTVD